MGDYLSAASVVLQGAQRRVEVSAQNIANATTPGYRTRVSFDEVMAQAGLASTSTPNTQTSTVFTPGKQNHTGSRYDMAIDGDGFFVVKAQDRSLYTRDGQFHRDVDGRIVNRLGMPLQLEGGGDLVLQDADFQVLSDGAIVQGGSALGRLAVVDFTDRAAAHTTDGGLFEAPDGTTKAVATPVVRQGSLETSNVSLGDEMVVIMESLRRAEMGQRLVTTYDDLLGRAITSFGQ